MARPKNETCAVCGRKAHPDGIRHLPSKRYQARFLGPDGRSHSQTFQTTRDATAWLSQQRADISRERWESKSTLVVVQFRDYATRWLAERKVKGRDLADRTLSNYRDLLDKHILPTFGNRPIHLITRDVVELWYAKIAEGRPTTGRSPTRCCGRSWPALWTTATCRPIPPRSGERVKFSGDTRSARPPSMNSRR